MMMERNIFFFQSNKQMNSYDLSSNLTCSFFFLISNQGVSDNKSQTEENIFALFKGG